MRGNAAFSKHASSTASSANRPDSQGNVDAFASNKDAENSSSSSSSSSLSSSTDATVERFEGAFGSHASEGSEATAREREAPEASTMLEPASLSDSSADHDAIFDDDVMPLSSIESADTSSSSSSLASASSGLLPHTKHRSRKLKLSRVDRQLRTVSKLCDADFRNQLRSSVHGRSHAPMPKLAAVSAAFVKLREVAELNAERRKANESASGKTKGPSEAVNLSNFEFGCFDLFGSVDGILWKIFSEIGFVERKAVALVSETEWRHAAMNLVMFADFEAVIIGTSVDSHSDAEAALTHPSLPKGLIGSRVSLVEEFATKENVNHIISCLTALRLPRQPVHCTDKGMSGSIDLLLMDVGGGMDYWILDKITEVQPRVIVVKILPEMSTQAIPLVRPYKMDYTSTLRADRGIPILTAAAWAKKNGYRVVGCDSEASHAFLLLDGVGDAIFPSIDARSCAPKVRDPQLPCGFAFRRYDGFHRCQPPRMH